MSRNNDDDDGKCHLSRLSLGTSWPDIAAVGSRPEQRVLARLRFGHLSLQSWRYLYRGADFQHCRCGHYREDVPHFLMHCPRMQREIRDAVGPRTDITEHLLLGASAVKIDEDQQKRIISAVALFVKETISSSWHIW